ncbi:MAG: DUF4836 family protein [Chitinophagaceae bacterium]|nr:DUF4836 family protein [Chitinophagaceae bacterium]MCW5904740.1 DUF4836 family protein [Chitinophagaceae bacterium]
MNKKIYQLFFIASVAIVMASCGKKTPKEAKYIPKDATAVVVVNPKSLDNKLKSGNLTIDSFLNRFKDKFMDMSEDDKKKLEDFKNNGVSFEDNIFFFMVQRGSLQKGIVTTANLMLSLKDKAKFEKYIKEQKEYKAENLVQEKDYAYLSGDDKISIAWNNEIVTLSYYYKDSKSLFNANGDYVEPDMNEERKEQQNEVARYFSLKENESIASVSYFNDMFKTKADGYFFSSSAGALGYLSATPLNIPKMQELLQDNYSVATFNFDNGQILAKSTTYTNPMLSSILKKYTGSKVNTHLTEFFPSQNMNGTLLLSFNPELFDGILKELEVKGMLEGFLTQVGLTSADVFKALKGEINIALADFTIETKEVTYPSFGGTGTEKYTKTEPSFKLIVTAPIGDITAFNNVMNKGVENGFFVKTSTGYGASKMMASSDIYFSADDKTVVIASSEELYKTYLANKTKSNVSSDILSAFSGKTMATYIDINSFIKGSMNSVKDSSIQKAMNRVNATFKNVISTTDNFSGKSISGKVEVNLVNDKENSLVSILNMISDIYKISQEKEKKISTEAVPAS